jgi:hypothetical protein
MDYDLKGMISLITTMHKEQIQASKDTNENIGHLRETMHKLANDMTGVATLTTILNQEVKELKKKQSDDISAVHVHIDKETKELSIKIDAISADMSKVKISQALTEDFKGQVRQAKWTSLGAVIAVVLLVAKALMPKW